MCVYEEQEYYFTLIGGTCPLYLEKGGIALHRSPRRSDCIIGV